MPPRGSRRWKSSARRAREEKQVISKNAGGPGGIRTLGTLVRYAPLAKVCFRPLSHRSSELASRGGCTQPRRFVNHPAKEIWQFFTGLKSPARPWRYAVMRLLLLPVLALLASCSLFEDEKREAPMETSRPRLVGRVASIPAGADFVLIEAYGPWKVPDGGMLSGIGTEGRTSNLAVTGEKSGQFLAADIRSGVAKIGDSVYYRPVAGSGEALASEEPAAPGALPPQLETQKAADEDPAKP
jgi:hypothetical protein